MLQKYPPGLLCPPKHWERKRATDLGYGEGGEELSRRKRMEKKEEREIEGKDDIEGMESEKP